MRKAAFDSGVRKGVFACLAIGLVVITSGAFAQNLVQNGSFEAHGPLGEWPHYADTEGWTAPGGSGVNDNTGPFWDNATGLHNIHGEHVFFAQGGQVISQSVAGFEDGQTYTLRFLENTRNAEEGVTVDCEVRVGGAVVVASHQVGNGAFTAYEVDFASPGAGEFLLEFDVVISGGDGTFLLDAVSIVPQGEPNPFPLNDPPPPVEDVKLYIPGMASAPAIDGSGADPVWDTVPWTRASDRWNATAPDSAEDMSARFKVGHHNNRIYFLVEVTDDDRDNTNPEFWAKDSVEVFLDLGNVGGDLGDFDAQRTAWESTGGPVQLRFHYPGGQVEIGDSPYSSDTAVYATNLDSPTVTVYEIELSPPAAVLPLASIDSFGFCMHLVDADDGQYHCSIAWWGGPQQPLGVYNDPPDTGGVMPWQNADVNAEAGFVASTSGLPIVSDDDLLVYFDFDSVGATVADGSGNGRHGTVVGEVIADGEGMRGGSARFGPAGRDNTGFLTLDLATFAPGDIPTDAFTLAAWVNVQDPAGEHAIFNVRAADGSWLIHPEIREAGYRLRLRGAGGTSIANISTGTVAWNEWVHYAATYDMATGYATLYINGEILAQQEADNLIPLPSDWGYEVDGVPAGIRVGANIIDGNRPFTGLMDEFYLFKRALSQAEIQALFSAELATVEVPDVLGGEESVTLEEAEAVLAAAGLTVGSLVPRWSDTVPVGRIMGQSPAAGSSVPEGSAVNLEISQGPAPDMPVGGAAGLAILITSVLAIGAGAVFHRRK